MTTTTTTSSGSRRLAGRWVIAGPCTSRKALRTDSQKGIGEILNAKLATIVEEPESSYQGSAKTASSTSKSRIRDVKLWFKGKKGNDSNLVRSTNMFKRSKLQLVSRSNCVKGSYISFLAGFLAKGSLNGLPRFC